MRISLSYSMLSQRTCDKVERVAGTRARLEVASLCSGGQRAAGGAGAGTERRAPATATTAGGMRQVTNSRKAAARYSAEYLRQSNAPTSAAATCDNTVRCARTASPRGPRARHLHSTRHWVRNQSNGLSAFYLQYLLHAPGPPLPNIALLSVLRPRHSDCEPGSMH